MSSNDCTACPPKSYEGGVQLPSRVLLLVVCMFYVYILYSQRCDRFYIVYSDQPDKRLIDHNSGKVKSTRNFRLWTKVYQEEFETGLLAIRRERHLKSMKSKKFIQQLVDTSRYNRDEQ